MFYFVFEGNFQVQAPGGLTVGAGSGGGMRFSGGFFASSVWGAYIWRGLFLEFYGIDKIFLSFQVPLNSSLKSIKNGKILKFKIYV